MWRQFLLFLVLCTILSSCAARESTSPVTPIPEAAPAAQTFNEQVAALPEGSTQYFAESPFGPISIDAGQFYRSGLGNECRSVSVTRESMSYRFALCKEENGAWSFIPTVFESMPR